MTSSSPEWQRRDEPVATPWIPRLSPMDVKERRALIEEWIQRDGEVSFVVLAERCAVSEMTIRRDVEALESQGIVRRIVGGAIAVPGKSIEPPYDQRAQSASDSKAHIAVETVKLLRAGETVILDSGSTVLAVARAIRGQNLGLTIVTPSIKVALELADEPETTVLLTGGLLRPGELSLIGSEVDETFRRYNCDAYVMGVAGVDAERGLTEYHRQEGGVKISAAHAADRVIVAADRSKLGRVQLVNIAPLAGLSAIVSDGNPDHPALVAARAAGVQVVCVPPMPLDLELDATALLPH